MAALAHDDGVTCLARNPRRLNSLLSGAADGDVRLWDIPARRCLRRLVGHSGPVKGISMTPDGEACVSCSTDCTVKLWEVRVGAGGLAHAGRAEVAVNIDTAVTAGAGAGAGPRVFEDRAELSWRVCPSHQLFAHPPPRRPATAAPQVPFAPFDGGPIQEDPRPVLEFSGKHAFRAIDHHWERQQFATAGAAVEVWDHERAEPVTTFSWGADTISSGGCWCCVCGFGGREWGMGGMGGMGGILKAGLLPVGLLLSSHRWPA